MQPHDRPAPVLGADGRQIHPDKFGRPPADIHHQKLFGRRVDQGRAGNHRQPRLFLGGDDLDLKAGFTPDLAHEIAPVAGPAAGLGGHKAHPADAVLFDLLLADPQGLQGPPHRGMRQPARSFQPRAQMHCLGKSCPRPETGCPMAGQSACGTNSCQDPRRHKARPWLCQGLTAARDGSRPWASRPQLSSRPPLGDARASCRPPYVVGSKVCPTRQSCKH